MAVAADPAAHHPAPRLLQSAERPSPGAGDPPSPAGLSAQALDAVRRCLLAALRRESESDLERCWESSAWEGLKRYLHGCLGNDGEQTGMYQDKSLLGGGPGGDSALVQRPVKSMDWDAREDADQEARANVRIHADLRSLTEKRMFAIWWLFVPESNKSDEAAAAAVVIAKRPVPALEAGATFRVQQVTCLARRKVELDHLHLAHNWILARDTVRMLEVQRSNLRHLTLGGRVTRAVLEVLEKNVSLETFRISANCKDPKWKGVDEALASFVRSQGETLRFLDVANPYNKAYVPDHLESLMEKGADRTPSLKSDLVSALQACGGLNRLHLCDVKNLVLSDAPPDDGVAPFSCPSVEHLLLDFNTFFGREPNRPHGPHGLRTLFPSLKSVSLRTAFFQTRECFAAWLGDVGDLLTDVDLHLFSANFEDWDVENEDPDCKVVLQKILDVVSQATRLSLTTMSQRPAPETDRRRMKAGTGRRRLPAPVFPNLTHLYLRLEYAPNLPLTDEDLLLVCLGAPKLQSLAWEFDSVSPDFDQKEFAGEVAAAAAAKTALATLQHFRLYSHKHTVFMDLTVPRAILTSAPRLKTLSDLTWMNFSTEDGERFARLAEERGLRCNWKASQQDQED